jgi:hypothetical protein
VVDYVVSGANTIVQLSNDADASPESQIQLTGIVSLSALDFYL